MKLVHVETLFARGAFAGSAEREQVDTEIRDAISRVVWPPGSDGFTIHPQSGKKRGEGNGVTPIKAACMAALQDVHGWTLEARYKIGTGKGTGPIDALRDVMLRTAGESKFALEWETGNISSSHRSLNKMCLGMIEGRIAGGAIVLPSGSMYPYLTDRVGNYPEIRPYLNYWRDAVTADGVLAIYVVEQDAESYAVPRIPKGTDGRALR